MSSYSYFCDLCHLNHLLFDLKSFYLVKYFIFYQDSLEVNNLILHQYFVNFLLFMLQCYFCIMVIIITFYLAVLLSGLVYFLQVKYFAIYSDQEEVAYRKNLHLHNYFPHQYLSFHADFVNMMVNIIIQYFKSMLLVMLYLLLA